MNMQDTTEAAAKAPSQPPPPPHSVIHLFYRQNGQAAVDIITLETKNAHAILNAKEGPHFTVVEIIMQPLRIAVSHTPAPKAGLSQYQITNIKVGANPRLPH